ncbi:hypothetical protein PV11_05960 [Exophiala sideris]|uniref:Xylanolytic transcriptional activator regulatory domain-containing protein n=1 Tax=Exophiala sideris TaxID=1016849 RepID=A0A0D1W5U0_9EURO|nr:hypothetical protein PV11_05960 [Exophiala sideris]
MQQLPSAVQELLQEVYFTCQFHSTLLFHQPTFAQDFKDGHVDQHVLLAMYANATMYVPPILSEQVVKQDLTECSFLLAKSSLLGRYADNLRSVGDLRAAGRRWALQAARNVLQDIDQPTFESVQTCEMLSLYWFSVGDYKRNAMFLSIAYSAACMLELDSADGPVCLKGGKSSASAAPEWLRAEMARRCFWAVWFTRCIITDHCLTGLGFSDKLLNLPLPMDEISFARSHQVPSETLSALLVRSSKPSNTERQLRNSILAELMILALYWVKIRQLVEARAQMAARNLLADVYDLEGQLVLWRSGLSDQFSYSKRNLYDQPIPKQQSLFILVHALYHQCRIVLHSSLVPQYSGLQLPETIPAEVINASARIALRSAQEISNLGADLSALDWDPTRTPGFVGYCMYVSASIHIGVLGSTDSLLKACARTSLASNFEWLNSMSMYWSNSEKLWERIQVLYDNQMSRLRASNGEENDAISTSTSPLKDLDQLASEVRDPGRFPEPLADSVLAYSLRRFRPIDKVQGTIPEVNHATLLQMLSGAGENSTMSNAAPPSNQNVVQTMSVAEVEGNHVETSAVPLAPGPRNWMARPQIAAPHLTYWDWWDMNVDMSQHLGTGPGELLNYHGEPFAPDIAWPDIMSDAP